VKRSGVDRVPRTDPKRRTPHPRPVVTGPDERGVTASRGPHTEYSGPGNWDRAYLPGVEVNRDQIGGSSRVRPAHCTSSWLTPASIPNVDTSDA